MVGRAGTRYQIPVFLFINKMDQPGTDRETLLVELKEKLDTNCVDFSADQTSEDWKEQVAVCDEQVMEAYLEGEEISRVQIQKMIRERKLFPCYFGSALKLTGVKEFLEDLKLRIRESSYPESFGAKIYKITRDSQGERLSHMKITGGALKVKSVLSNGKPGERGEGIWHLSQMHPGSNLLCGIHHTIGMYDFQMNLVICSVILIQILFKSCFCHFKIYMQFLFLHRFSSWFTTMLRTSFAAYIFTIFIITL